MKQARCVVHETVIVLEHISTEPGLKVLVLTLVILQDFIRGFKQSKYLGQERSQPVEFNCPVGSLLHIGRMQNMKRLRVIIIANISSGDVEPQKKIVPYLLRIGVECVRFINEPDAQRFWLEVKFERLARVIVVVMIDRETGFDQQRKQLGGIRGRGIELGKMALSYICKYGALRFTDPVTIQQFVYVEIEVWLILFVKPGPVRMSVERDKEVLAAYIHGGAAIATEF
jgi:hypothetical protein